MDPAERKAKALEALAGCEVRSRRKRKGRTVSSFRGIDEPSGRNAYMSCKRKHRYRTQADATRHMHILMTIRPDQPLRAYMCRYCGGWHLTHKAQRQEKGRPAKSPGRPKRGKRK